MIATARNLVSEAWSYWTVRLAVLAVALGFVPFYFLTLATEALAR